MNYKELKDLIASNAKEIKELSISQKETDKQLKETDRQLTKQLKETDKQLKELGKQIGGIGNKFGSYTENIAMPSVRNIMSKKFKMDHFQSNVLIRKNGKTVELDGMAYANSDINKIFVIEIKSKVSPETFVQTDKIVEKFFDWFPEHKDKKLYIMLAGVNVPTDLREKILNKGWYFAEVNEKIFKLNVPKSFKPSAFTSC
jgi:hypothetical protein